MNPVQDTLEPPFQPLGPPTNRKPARPDLVRIVERPNWWRDKDGNATYIEPLDESKVVPGPNSGIK